MLASYRWEWFCTLTFRGDRVHPERADKAFRCWIEKVNRQVGGRRWWKRGAGVQWCKAIELQARGVIHFHVLVGGVGDARRLTAMDAWDDLAGFARVEPVRGDDGLAVRRYVSKYVVKGGELEVGGALGRVTHSWPARVKDWSASSLSRGSQLDGVREVLGEARLRQILAKVRATGRVEGSIVDEVRSVLVS